MDTTTSNDKVPAWKVALSLNSIWAEGAQTRLSRPYTVHEKVKGVWEFVCEHDLISETRPSDPRF
jgi:hypothetical protein